MVFVVVFVVAAATIVVEDEEKKKKEREQMIAELKKFWQNVLLLMQKAPDSSTLHDVARLEYTVPDSIVPSSAADADAKVVYTDWAVWLEQLGTREICCKIMWCRTKIWGKIYILCNIR